MYLDKKVIVIIVAAGKGTRMQSDKPKQYLAVKGVPILEMTIQKFEYNEYIDEIMLVINKNDINNIVIKKISNYKKVKNIVKGGRSRTESVYNGLCYIKEKDSIVLIHDGVRPFVSNDIIKECISSLEHNEACIPAINVIDTIKLLDGGVVKETIDRSKYCLVQTPQAFKYLILKECYDKAIKEKINVTDDASVLEKYGRKIKVIKGNPKNIKITNPFDLKIAEIILEEELEINKVEG